MNHVRLRRLVQHRHDEGLRMLPHPRPLAGPDGVLPAEVVDEAREFG